MTVPAILEPKLPTAVPFARVSVFLEAMLARNSNWYREKPTESRQCTLIAKVSTISGSVHVKVIAALRFV